MRSDAVDQYIHDAKVSSVIADGLSDHDTHAYVVLEVYRAKSLDIQASGNTDFDISLGQGAQVSDCSQPSAQPGTVSKNPPSTAAANKSTAAATTESITASSDSGQGSDVGVAAAVCKSSKGTLKFSSNDPMPFLVRLAEVEKDAHGQLHLKHSKFKLPKSLGASPVESITAQPAGKPIIATLQHHGA